MTTAAAPAATLTFDRDGAKFFRRALDRHLEALSTELGIKVDVKGALRFNPDEKTFSLKIEASAGADTDRARFEAIAPTFGFAASDFGRDLWGATISGITANGCLQVVRAGEPRRYKAAALPKIIRFLHPTDEERQLRARLEADTATPEDWKKPFPPVKP